MAKSVDVVRKLVELHDSGRLQEGVFDDLLQGVDLTVGGKTGTFSGGMLDLRGRLHTLNLSALSSACKTEEPQGGVGSTGALGVAVKRAKDMDLDPRDPALKPAAKKPDKKRLFE